MSPDGRRAIRHRHAALGECGLKLGGRTIDTFKEQADHSGFVPDQGKEDVAARKLSQTWVGRSSKHSFGDPGVATPPADPRPPSAVRPLADLGGGIHVNGW